MTASRIVSTSELRRLAKAARHIFAPCEFGNVHPRISKADLRKAMHYEGDGARWQVVERTARGDLPVLDVLGCDHEGD